MIWPAGGHRMISPQLWGLLWQCVVAYGWHLEPCYGVESHAVRTLTQ